MNDTSAAVLKEKLDQRTRLAAIIAGFDATEWQTTGGLMVFIRSAGRLIATDDTTWMHVNYPNIEKTLKDTCLAMLKVELAALDEWLDKRVTMRPPPP